MRFVHEALPQRVRFAPGGVADALVTEVGELGATRVMVVSGGSASRVARDIAGALPVVHWHDAGVRHVPVEVARRARAVAEEVGADLLVSVGGGSSTGLAKAVALTSGIPVVAVPTTYAGSEATDVWGLTDGGRKTTGRSSAVLPRAVVYDVSLTLDLPVEVSVTSGLNALAHGVDSLWAPGADPVNAALAASGLRELGEGLRQVVADPRGLPGRDRTLIGAHLAAAAFASAGSGLHHKVCHVLGGMFDLPHAPTHAVVLPHVLALNAPHAPGPAARIAEALGAADPQTGLRSLCDDLAAPRALRDLGMPRDGVPSAVEAILDVVPSGNPAPVTREALTDLVHRAWEGAEP